MAENLIEYLQAHPAQGFRPMAHYSHQGDFVIYYFRNAASYAQRIDELLTVFRSFETNELVGCKIKGIQHILRTAGAYGVNADHGQVELKFFIFIGAAMASDEAQVKCYEELREKTEHVSLDRNKLQLVS